MGDRKWAMAEARYPYALTIEVGQVDGPSRSMPDLSC